MGTTYVPPGAQNTVNVGGMNNGGFNSSTVGSTGFGSQTAGSFGNSGSFGNNSGFGAPAGTIVTGFGGKPAPMQPQQPML